MKHLSFLLLSFFVFVLYANPVFALEVVYPKSLTPKIYAKSTFFIGNIGENKEFYINGEKINTYKDGIFVHVVPLDYGENSFELKSLSDDGEVKSLMYNILRPKPVSPASIKAQNNVLLTQNQIKSFDGFTVVEVSKDNIPLRKAATDNSDRVVHLDKGATLLIDAQKGDFYRVFADINTKYWIRKDYFTEVRQSTQPLIFDINHFKYSYDRRFEYFQFKTGISLPYVLKEMENGVCVSIYYISNIPQKLEKYVQDIKFENGTLSFFIPHDKLWGYDFYYDGESMVFRLRREVKVDTHNPLKNLVIAVDAGHGGRDGGAVGPTKKREADIVLDIAKKLRDILCKEGAQVVMTRDKDDYVDLYDRVRIIKAVKPLFAISIHANALPDGADPYLRYGTSVYYYQPQAKEFADVVKNAIVGLASTRDDGTRFASFVMTRTTLPISILVETAYMINPTDYINLLDEKFREKLAQSIAAGIKAYMQASVPK